MEFGTALPMRINDWPLYINDNGVINCYKAGCDDELIEAFVGIGRRTHFAQLRAALIIHAREFHGIELSDD